MDPEQANAAARNLLAQGLTPEGIIALAEQARLATAAVKGKTEDEVKALLTPPAFLSAAPAAPVAPAPVA